MNASLMPPSNQILKVGQLTDLIKTQLEENFVRVWVQGEVSNLRQQSSGHVYFSLKDDSSQLSCVLFARDATRQSFQLKDGMAVILLGDISVFKAYGRYQLITKIAIQSGTGGLQLEFERMKRALAEEGLFEESRKRRLPALPRRIAVITSPTGAAIRDFLRILKRRGFQGELVIFPARVQGKEATEEVRNRLRQVTAGGAFDLVVLTRGGGSIEDLRTFNEEAVVRAVAACSIPVISAIGHEIDHVLTDYVADRRAETPSGAAELISSLYLNEQQRYERMHRAIHQWVQSYLSDIRNSLRYFASRMQIIAPERCIQDYGMRLDESQNRMSRILSNRISQKRQKLAQQAERMAEHHPQTRIRPARRSLDDISRRLRHSREVGQARIRDRLQHLKQRLESGSLQSVLKRGFAIIERNDAGILDSARDAEKEKQVWARFHDGKVSWIRNPSPVCPQGNPRKPK